MFAKIEKTTESFYVCSRCGKKYYTLYGGQGGQFRCSKCDLLFNEGKPISKADWIIETIDAIRCDICNNLVPCNSENYAVGSSYPRLMCPECNDAHEDGVYVGHNIAIKFADKWYLPAYFLYQEDRRSGIFEAEEERDRITLDVLNMMAMAEVSYFRSIPHSNPAKIFWKDGNAMGYYSYDLPPISPKPTLRQVFVRNGNRKTGMGSKLITDFLDGMGDQKVRVESPNQETLRLLHKLGHLKIENGMYVSKGRISFFEGL